MTSRRSIVAGSLAAPFAGSLRGAAPAWNVDWDRSLITRAVEQQNSAFDAEAALLRRNVGGDYNYHSTVRRSTVHPTRDSIGYALLLLEAGGDERAARAAEVINHITELQDTDPASKWYGIWGYHMEEPPPKMSPADWNWADFIGSTLLLIAYRHGKRLPRDVFARTRTAILHAARSVERRNVSMSYTNIAVQGTFVTLAAAELLDDAALSRYAKDRLRRFAANVDESGSFAEYNSPTYAEVTITNLTRIRMTVRDNADLALTDKIHTRAWQHLAAHWHAPTRQLAGPMSRCYSTDIRSPLWIQKATGGKLQFATFEQIRSGEERASGEIAVHDYRCPEQLVPMFLSIGKPHQHREVFVAGKPAGADIVHNRADARAVPPIQGTTWLDNEFCLGSANRADMWVQRRGLLAYWGGAERPARFAQLRFMKNDYDFSSALLYTVQEKNAVLGAVNFRSPGGDRHISLDPIRDGAFPASRFRLRLDLAGVPNTAEVLEGASRIAVDLGAAKLFFAIREAVFGDERPKLSLAREDGRLVLSLDLIPSGQERTIRWSEIGTGFIAFTLAMDGKAGTLADFDRRCRAMKYSGDLRGGRIEWATPVGHLALAAGTAIRPVAEQDAAFSDSINGERVPIVRLSNHRLLS